mmetsp:Transcript_37089/g.54519  ORF Transcript_37089/g.54519 Transcript_37089/m.54519 type:complete len:479 (+) Transcript_37089:136-1572(+)|eukprot:CAMPEP_0195526748 /NCGR_PEP_ID=MMETSP0794_2-20130614/28003_1 /TAXON_ID=515487 /ORGANISM="Stephanopyxis turris, Strain CCMP 815" /LENGTH=478 /DNA_ID=CAMNT_0040657511 /DNA_START=130 /DNA_END=1566 /DNA_ORIENTATION=-
MPPRQDNLSPIESNRNDGKGCGSHVTKEKIPKLLFSPPITPVKDTGSRVGLFSQLQLPPTISLPILNFIDMFAVSLVVPILFQHYKAAGVTSASQRELLSSFFSSSQIFGGLLLGYIADSGLLHRRTIILISFLGSAISYGLILHGTFLALVCSQVIVGLVKQTYTIVTTMIAKHTTKENRTKHMARLSASAKAAWIIGPSVGGFLFKNVDEKSPVILACVLFLLNSLLVVILIPVEEGRTVEPEGPSTSSLKRRRSSITEDVVSCFVSKQLASVIISLLIFTWVTRVTSNKSIASYYEDMYQIEPHQRGYLVSYQTALSFIVQSTLVAPFLAMIGGERKAVVLSIVVLATVTWMEIYVSLSIFLLLLCPASSVSTSLIGISLRSLVADVAQSDSLGSVFAAVDVLQSVAAFTTPFYRTLLFSFLGTNDNGAAMEGDPDPQSWVFASGIHWFLAACVIGFLLLSPGKRSHMEKQKKMM